MDKCLIISKGMNEQISSRISFIFGGIFLEKSLGEYLEISQRSVPEIISGGIFEAVFRGILGETLRETLCGIRKRID